MPEYSSTFPSGMVAGKYWRAADYYASCGYVVCAYAEHENPNLLRILYHDVVLRHGPQPRGYYAAPDWSYYRGWREQRARERMENAS